MTVQDIIPDAEIERVHAHANFGGMTKRDVVNEGVWKVACGWSMGATMSFILVEHGLAKFRPNPYFPPYLTKKGKEYLFAALKHAKIEWRNDRVQP